MPSARVQRYVDAHLKWRNTEGQAERDRLLNEVRASRGVLKGREFKEAADLIAAANGRPTVQYTHTKTEEQMAQEATATETVAKPKKEKKAVAKPKAKAKKKAVKVEGSIIDNATRKEYEKSNVKTASGARSISNGDTVAKALNGLTVEQLEKVAKRADIEDRFKGWNKLNPGMQRMNLGNVLRAQIKNGDVKAKATIAEAAKMDREVVGAKKPAKKEKVA